MYYLCGLNDIIRNIQVLTNFNPEEWPILNKSISQGLNKPLAYAYHQFLIKNSIFRHTLSMNANEIKILDSVSVAEIVKPDFKEKLSSFEGAKQEEWPVSLGYFYNALLQLKRKNRELYQLIKFIIKVILINPFYESVEDDKQHTIGAAFVNFKANFNKFDFIEIIIHQLVHMTLYIDNFIQEHISSDNKILMIETGLKYKFGGTRFPLYVAFHSYMVGVEILQFRFRDSSLQLSTTCHGSTQKIIEICQKFEESLLPYHYLFNEKAKMLLLKASLCLKKVGNYGGK